MKHKEKNAPQKPRKSTSTKVLYIAASVVALAAVTLLINNIILFKDSVAMYVAQGYPSADVMKQLIPAQLLPGIFEPLALYGGIAFILFAAAIINEKISKCLIPTTNAEVSEACEACETCIEPAEESTLEENVDEDNTELSEETE